MYSPLTLVSLLSILSFSAKHVLASPCLAMDANFNLLVLGYGGKDFNAGQQSTWTGTTPATDITTTGRPPFDGTNTTCYLSQFQNVVYVMNADASSPSSVYIYDAGAKSWSKQSVNTQTANGPVFDPSNFVAILDHDTDVFYALSAGEMFFLDVGGLKTANSSAITWNDVGKPNFDTTNYQPVMALAQNHIHFLDIPGNQAGQANIFVIHFSFFQPAVQSFPVNGSGSNFPEQHGQATSFFQTEGVQQEFAFIPDDGSATYVVNVENNSTAVLAGPTNKDSKATYFAGVTSLVQLDSSGHITFLPYQQDDASVNSQAQWTTLTTVTVVSNPSSSGNSSSSASGSQTAGASKTSSGPTASNTNTSGSMKITTNNFFLMPLVLGAFATVASLL